MKALIAMRLDRMRQNHPGQDNTRVCANCGAPVGVYPDGQAELKANAALTIACDVCFAANPGLDGSGRPSRLPV